ncbi:DUF2909 domain-containing protein [Vibrio sp. MarTm2]|uniref:DUF2909 domain-containing protein n=3 Tax=Vibrio TaxID=662 RepID=A0A0A5I0X5_PHOS4|nr:MULTISPECIES: DUF2909 domain-containing protein [Vibrio]KGY10190.1 hypothetical protein NM06_04570 [Vibrio sinaloensis]KHA59514.1 hypothetical protein NL53_17430 [Vibrio variabilis]KHD25830.1 hypothetical protein NM09_03485 [Vibrio caribbeanicus]KHT47766.1 hypothetical protein RJ47_02775 [Vibrio sinaloensis]KHT51186.1 hypothetical protein RJ46_04655 [Vibrio sinaloensis]
MVFLFKLLLVVLLLFIIFNLARAMIEMVKGPQQDDEDTQQPDKPMSFYLGRRVFLSALAVVLMVAALLSGFIDPNVRPY